MVVGRKSYSERLKASSYAKPISETNEAFITLTIIVPVVCIGQNDDSIVDGHNTNTTETKYPATTILNPEMIPHKSHY